MKQAIRLTNEMNLAYAAQPIRQGVPWPRGAVRDADRVGASDSERRPLPIATRVLNRWPDGSVQWLLVDMAVDVPPNGTREIVLDSAATQPAPAPAHPVAVDTMTDGAITVTNGLLRLSFSGQPGAIVMEWTCEGREVVRPGGFDVRLVDAQGVAYTAAAGMKRAFVEEASPLRAVVRVEGKHASAQGTTLLDYWLRFTVTAGRADVTVTYHYHNLEDYDPAAPGVPQALLRSLRLRFETALPPETERAIIHAMRGARTRPEYYRLREDLEICSADKTDVTDYEQTHQARGLTGGGLGRVFVRDVALLRDDPAAKPWFLRQVVDFKFGSVNQPEAFVYSYLGLVSRQGSLVAAGLNMLGLHPKALGVTGSELYYDIWPAWAGTMDITQGEGRTLTFCLGALAANATDAALAARYFSWEHGLWSHQGVGSAVHVSLDPDHVRACQVFAVEKLPAPDPQRHFAFERKVQARWTPAQKVPATGHWNFGDMGGNYVNAGNNIEMAGLPWFQEYLRTGRAECLDVGLAQAQHIIDVDLVAKSAYPYQEGGMVAHCPRHNHGAAYPSHMWFTELLFAYALTGDREYLAAAGRTCDNLVFWINDPWGFETVCADGREAGQPLINLAWTYEFLPEPRYLQAIRKVVRECYIDKARRLGRLTYLKPHEGMPFAQYDGYGDWAAWEGLFWVWNLTGDKELQAFLLEQLAARLTEERMNTATNDWRSVDYNAAAFAFYLSGDPQWLRRVARPFRVLFRCVEWPFAWAKSMYYIKLAFEHGIIEDDDVLLT